jgi:hypothetical protein
MLKSYVSTEGDEMLKNNYDLNIWDKVGYETEYQQEGWSIAVYTIPNNGVAYGSGTHVHDIDLTLDESKTLTLGLSATEGGDYSPDSDFWMDAVTFFMVYRNIPRRIEQEIIKIIEAGGSGTIGQDN